MPDAHAGTLAELLKQYRMRAHLSQEELAQRAGLSVRGISDLERGLKQRPHNATVRALVQALGLSAQEQVAFEVLASGAAPSEVVRPAAAPPVAAGPTRAHNLPAQLTSFVGRERDVAAVVELLLRPDVRLLTLTGPGGAGKTRLAVRVAEDLLARFADGVRFVDLAPISDPGLASLEIARTLGVPETGVLSPLNAVAAHLRDRQMLLLLDNFEQVVLAAPVAIHLLLACPGLKVLATSRVTLHVRGEQVYPVPPLSLPDPLQPVAVQQLSQYEAVQLFVVRAQAGKPGFAITTDNAAAVAHICRRLDGLPLAIELAAARVRFVPPQTILARLSSRLALLTGGAQDLPTRHQTLRATLDWSYDLLPKAGQTLLGRLAVFTGGCVLEAAEVVCVVDRPGGRDPLHGNADLLDGISSLIDHSLLREEERLPGEAAFSMPETVREYALARLAESGEADVLRERHAAYYRTLADAAEQELKGPRQAAWLHRLEAERDNLRAALLWAHERGQAEVGLRLAGALQWFWLMRGYLTEGRTLLERALAAAGGSPAARAKALTGNGMLTWRQGDFQGATTLLHQALELYQELGDTAGTAFALHHAAHVDEAQGDYTRAVTRFEDSLALFRDSTDQWGLALTLNCLAEALQQQGEHDRALALLREGMAQARQVGDQHTRADMLRLMGQEHLRQGDHTRAGALVEEGLTHSLALKDTQGTALALHILAGVALGVADYERAGDLSRECLRLHDALGQKLGIAECLGMLAAVAVRQGRHEHAVRLLGAVAALLTQLGAPLAPAGQVEYARTVAAARTHLGEHAFQMAWEAGEAMSPAQAMVYAMEAVGF